MEEKKLIWTTNNNRCLSFGVLLACERNSKHICVSIINKRLSYPQRQTNYSAQQASSTDQQVLQALYCMKSLISGGILLAWAVFLELLLIITLTCWTYWWTKRRRYDENVCFSLHGNGGLYVNCVLYQDGQGKGHENPKMVIILRGGGERGLRLNTSVLPLVLFSDCKIKSRLLPEQSKAAIWNSGNLELKNKLEWSVNFSAGSGGGKKVLTRTTHSSFTTQSNCLNMFTRNSTTLKH